MRKPISVVSWVFLAFALAMLPAPACAGWGYSAVDVFSTTVVGTSTTYLESGEFYEGYRPYVEGTLSREWQTLGSNYQFDAYSSYVSIQVWASLEPGNAMYYMDGVHYAGMDEWNLQYMSSTYCGYYYFDPAAMPPYIYGISPNVGVSGTPGYIPIYGAYLAPQGTTPQVSMDGTTLWIVYQSDNQINVYYNYVSLGTHDLRVTTIYGTSNAVQFTALTGDATPSITSISPDQWEAGTTTDFSISGTGFGTNPGLTIDGGWIEAYGVYSAWDIGMNAWVRVSSNAPDQTVTVTVTSNGYWGNSFMEQYPNQPRSGSANVQVNGAAAPVTVEININNTPENDDDITLLNPAQTVSAQFIAHNGSGTAQLSVPSGKASINPTSLNLTDGVPAYVTITPSQRSNSVRDVQIVATSNGSQVGQAALTIVDVSFPQHIRHNDTPQEMPDRIPPRIDTAVQVTVQPSLSGSNQKVTLEPLDANATNGVFTIGGGSTQDIVQSGEVYLSGTTQTAATYAGNGGGNAGNLKIAAKVRGQTSAESNGFSVAAIPINYTDAYYGPETEAGRVGLVVQDGWSSDSGVLLDLDEVRLKELIDVTLESGVYQGGGTSTSGYLSATVFSKDYHSDPASWIHADGGGRNALQVNLFSDRRTGAYDTNMSNSGFQIVRAIALDSRSVWDLTVWKYAVAVELEPLGEFHSAAGATTPPEGIRCQSNGTGACLDTNQF